MKKLLEKVTKIAEQAGDAILEIYQKPIEVKTKVDGSPYTVADKNAHEIIQNSLAILEPGIPILSEESVEQISDDRFKWQQYWLIDPLDGTREFIKHNGEFTVNIALISQSMPVLGVVYTPVKQLFHYAAEGVGALKRVGHQAAHKIRTRKFNKQHLTIALSRSHSNDAVHKYLQRLAIYAKWVDPIYLGSSLKIVQIAEGIVDIYPRLGTTSKWDTAAAHCVLERAGGTLIDVEGLPLRYNKDSLLNPWFIAAGDGEFDWWALLKD